MVNVPQANIPAINVGEAAVVSVQERPGREFSGKLVRTANALDPTTRTLLAEVHVRNPNHVLLPGMYAQVRLADARSAPAILVPGDTLVVRSDGPRWPWFARTAASIIRKSCSAGISVRKPRSSPGLRVASHL